MNTQWLEALRQMGPEVAVLLTVISVILSDLFLGNEPKRLWSQTLLGMIAAMIAAVFLTQVQSSSLALPASISSTFLSTQLTSLLKVGVLALSALSVAFALRPTAVRHGNAAEFYTLMLFSTLGALLCISAQDLLMFFISFELLSLPLYMLCAFRRYDSASAEAGLKYFINGALSSAILLYGISWVYGSVGSTHLPSLALRYGSLQSVPNGLLIGLLFILVGLAFKVSAAPFHNWAPDVYTGAPPSVSVFLSSAPKIAMVGFILRFFWNYLDRPGEFFRLPFDWVLLFTIISVTSMFVGNLSALPQRDLRKLLAYSGIAQIGYIFLGLAACSEVSPHPRHGLSAVLFYTLVYGISNLGAWAVVSLSGRAQERYDLESLHGLHQRNPLLAVCLAVCLMSLAGVPPLAGFVGKFYLFRAIYESKLPFLVVLGILNSVISLFYYFNVLKAAYFVEAEDSGSSSIVLHPVQRLAVHICLWSGPVLGLWPGLMQVVDQVANSLLQGT